MNTEWHPTVKEMRDWWKEFKSNPRTRVYIRDHGGRPEVVTETTEYLPFRFLGFRFITRLIESMAAYRARVGE